MALSSYARDSESVEFQIVKDTLEILLAQSHTLVEVSRDLVRQSQELRGRALEMRMRSRQPDGVGSR